MNKKQVFRGRLLAAVLAGLASGTPCTAFDITYSISNPSSFTATQRAIVNEGMERAVRMWETMITGYQPGISIPTLPIQIQGVTTGLADASALSTTSQGGFFLSTSGRIRINVNEIENFANWQGAGANGLNFIDELLAHELGHVLGIGLHWHANGVYVGNGTYEYTGQYGLAAYQAEFDPAATFIPVENAGSIGTIGSHWDQRMRSSAFEGTPPPADPFLLDPRVGVTDQYGRDRSLELMTGAIDPDYREPFVSRFSVQSLRDLGFTVTEFEDFNGDSTVDHVDLGILHEQLGQKGLQVDSMSYGDADRDRDVDVDDIILWNIAASGSAQQPVGQPYLQYNDRTGALSVDFDGEEIFAFSISGLSAGLLDVTSAELPGDWDVFEFEGSIQAFDASILGGSSPALNVMAPNSAGDLMIVGWLPTGLRSLSAQLYFGLAVGGDGTSSLVTIVPEPGAGAMWLAAAICGGALSRKRRGRY